MVAKLALSKSHMVLDGGRRLHAAHLAYGEGVLVCPTNAGGVIALDVLTGSLLWANAYREEEPPPAFDLGFGNRRRPQLVNTPPNLAADFKTTAPIIVNGKVLFAAPDDPNIHCLSLRDGRPLWKTARTGGELFLAGVANGKAILVGSSECRALDLENGSVSWTVAVGLPSGQGVIVGNQYWLPIKATAKDKQAGLAVIDLEKGELRDFAAIPAGDLIGNLMVQDGTLISQSLDGVKAFPVNADNTEGQK